MATSRDRLNPVDPQIPALENIKMRSRLDGAQKLIEAVELIQDGHLRKAREAARGADRTLRTAEGIETAVDRLYRSFTKLGVPIDQNGNFDQTDPQAQIGSARINKLPGRRHRSLPAGEELARAATEPILEGEVIDPPKKFIPVPRTEPRIPRIVESGAEARTPETGRSQIAGEKSGATETEKSQGAQRMAEPGAAPAAGDADPIRTAPQADPSEVVQRNNRTRAGNESQAERAPKAVEPDLKPGLETDYFNAITATNGDRTGYECLTMSEYVDRTLPEGRKRGTWFALVSTAKTEGVRKILEAAEKPEEQRPQGIRSLHARVQEDLGAQVSLHDIADIASRKGNKHSFAEVSRNFKILPREPLEKVDPAPIKGGAGVTAAEPGIGGGAAPAESATRNGVSETMQRGYPSIRFVRGKVTEADLRGGTARVQEPQPAEHRAAKPEHITVIESEKKAVEELLPEEKLVILAMTATDQTREDYLYPSFRSYVETLVPGKESADIKKARHAIAEDKLGGLRKIMAAGELPDGEWPISVREIVQEVTEDLGVKLPLLDIADMAGRQGQMYLFSAVRNKYGIKPREISFDDSPRSETSDEDQVMVDKQIFLIMDRLSRIEEGLLEIVGLRNYTAEERQEMINIKKGLRVAFRDLDDRQEATQSTHDILQVIATNPEAVVAANKDDETSLTALALLQGLKPDQVKTFMQAPLSRATY